jgi:protein involved in polysaccharide export with SLBB domain
LAENQVRLLNESGSIDFTKLDDSLSEESKYIINDGDIIIIPKQENIVYVFGQVSNPGRVNFVEGKDYNYYINQAGGFGEFSDDDVMLIKGNSHKWISLTDNNVNIEDGDYIYIPKNPKRSFGYYLSLTSNYLSIVGSVATIILLLVQLNK